MKRELPIARAEFYFPNIDDPRILKAALSDFKKEWDEKSEIIEELKQYSNDNLMVQRTVRKPVMNTQRREFVEKRVFFNRSQAISMNQTGERDSTKTLGSKDDIY